MEVRYIAAKSLCRTGQTEVSLCDKIEPSILSLSDTTTGFIQS